MKERFILMLQLQMIALC